MKIEIKNVKYAAFASEETSCFNATVYVDGVKAGTAHNQGHGGPTDVEPFSLQQRIDEYAKTLPEKTTDMVLGGEPFTYAQTAETIIDDLLSDWLTERDFKRLLKRITIRRHDDPPGELKQFIASLKPTPENIKRVVEKNPHVIVLNALPYAEALAIYKGATP